MEEYWRHLDIDSWSVTVNEEIPLSGVGSGPPQNQINNITTEESHSRIGEASASAGKNIEKSKSKSRKNSRRLSNEMEISGEEGVTVKKLDHNAKERIRRMKLNASYLALRALLPDSRRSKKKWSAPAVVDRVLKYIPELEKEVEALRCSKEDVQSRRRKEITPSAAKYESPTISVNQVNEEEAILQVCMARTQESKLTHLLQSVEDEGMCIKSASALDISHTRISHHLHIQITTSEASHHFEELREKVIYWLT